MMIAVLYFKLENYVEIKQGRWQKEMCIFLVHVAFMENFRFCGLVVYNSQVLQHAASNMSRGSHHILR